MKRTTITLPDDVAAGLERAAQHAGVPASDNARQALAAYLGLEASPSRRPPFAALGRSGYTHTGRDMEEMLADERGRAGGR